MRDPYIVLNVSQNATIEEIKISFKKLSMSIHPDREGGSEELFKELNFAYQLLIDPIRRQKYDATGLTGDMGSKDDLVKNTAVQLVFNILMNHPEECDFIILAVSQVQNSINEKNHAIVVLLDKKEKIEKRAKRVKDTPKNKLLKKVIESKLEEFMKQITNLQDNIKIETAVIEELNNLEFEEVPLKPTMQSHYSFVQQAVNQGFGGNTTTTL